MCHVDKLDWLFFIFRVDWLRQNLILAYLLATLAELQKGGHQQVST